MVQKYYRIYLALLSVYMHAQVPSLFDRASASIVEHILKEPTLADQLSYLNSKLMPVEVTQHVVQLATLALLAQDPQQAKAFLAQAPLSQDNKIRLTALITAYNNLGIMTQGINVDINSLAPAINTILEAYPDLTENIYFAQAVGEKLDLFSAADLTNIATAITPGIVKTAITQKAKGRALIEAVLESDLLKIKQLVEQRAPLNVRDSVGRTALKIAEITPKDKPIAEYLLSKGATR